MQEFRLGAQDFQIHLRRPYSPSQGHIHHTLTVCLQGHYASSKCAPLSLDHCFSSQPDMGQCCLGHNHLEKKQKQCLP